MSASLLDTIGELRELLYDIHEQAEQTGYGFFPGGDPRTFTPDGECSTEEERKAHRIDCERVENGAPPFAEGGCKSGAYGLGTYTIEDPQAQDWAERLGRFIHQLEGVALQEEAS